MQFGPLEVIVAFDINDWRQRRVYWLKRCPISTHVGAQSANFCRVQQTPVMYFYTRLWLNQASSPVCWDDIVTAGSAARRSAWKGKGSRGCDGGIMEFLTGQRQTIDPSAGSLCFPLIRHSTHRSSAVHQAKVFLEEKWSSTTAAALLLGLHWLLPYSSPLIPRRRRSGISVKNHKRSV